MKEIDFYRYCPYCADKVETLDGIRYRCANCKRDIYLNAKPCANAVIVKNGRVLFAKRGSEPFKDGWGLPGGFLEYTETFEEALVREIKEELRVEVKIEKYLGSTVKAYPWQGVDFKVIPAYFLCSVKEEPTANDDVSDLFWAAPSDLDLLCFKEDKKLIKSLDLK